eukprot:TRINITY_DN972_c0_g1_i1.p2 TRINITY_DN972_c0_g1~~TRINITY_DN972_c0_g1_i1.p2  ORF type:complete len:382 (-),score=59.65 TRINITY_DN972_c0_g1_i1:1427-2428(-)
MKTLDDYYNIKLDHLANNHGYGLVYKYQNSPYYLLKNTIDYEWLPWKFVVSPKGYWNDIENQRKFIKWFEKEIGIESLEEWYNIPVHLLKQNYGSGLIQVHNSSVSLMIPIIYPEYKWLPWKFYIVRRGLWSSEDIIKEFLKYVEAEANIKTEADWYRLSRKQLHQLGGRGLLKKYKNLYKPLKLLYPNYDWNEQLFEVKMKKSSQRWLVVAIQKILSDPGEIIEDFQYASSHFKTAVEFDIWIPKLNLALEYQGEQHYKEIPALSGSISYSDWDTKKKQLAEHHGISLIVIPYWWKGDKESLKATISEVRPDLIPKESLPSNVTPIRKNFEE